MSCVAAENCGTYGREDEVDAEDEMVGPDPGVGVGVEMAGVVGFDACGVWSAMVVMNVGYKDGWICYGTKSVLVVGCD